MTEINFFDCKILNIKNLNHDVKQFTIQKPDGIGDFKTSSFVFISNIETKRPYTPIEISEKELKFAIKIYEKGEITQFLDKKKENEFIKISNVICKREYKKNEFKKILMIAGGTGITPMVQILREIQENEKVKTEVNLIFSNKTENDVFLNEILENFEFVNFVKIFSETDNKKYFKGHINKEIVSKYIENVDFVYVCGPPGFMEAVSGNKNADKTQGDIRGILKELNFRKDQIFKF